MKTTVSDRKPRSVAVIPAAGTGRRMNSGVKKTYLELQGVPVLARTLRAFEDCGAVDKAVVVVSPGDVEHCAREVVDRFGLKKVLSVVEGGATRQDSVRLGLIAAGGGWDVVVVHDGARPFVTAGLIDDCIRQAYAEGGAVAAVPVKDTIKEVHARVVRSTFERSTLWAAQTPQAFRFGLLKKAHERAERDGFTGTDESVLVERAGGRVVVVEGSYDNIKITTPEDIEVAAHILRKRAGEAR